MENTRIYAVLCTLLGAAACHSPGSAALPAQVAESIPSDTKLLVGLHLDQIRGTATYRSLPDEWRAVFNPVEAATDLWAAYNGSDLLLIAKGRFENLPPGAVRISPDLVLAGSPAAIQASQKQRATGHPGAPTLIVQAAGIMRNPVWAVADSSVPLPLLGNAVNLGRLMRMTSFVTVTATLNSVIELGATGVCATADRARSLEESARALVSLAAASTREPGLQKLLQSIQIDRQDREVHAAGSATVTELERLLQ